MVFFFPGQGSQFVGMGKDLLSLDPQVQAIFDSANDILSYDIQKLCFEGPIEELTKTQHTQPALLVYHAIMIQLLRKKEIIPSCVLGHSLGEFSALLAAGVFDFETALTVVQYRAQVMSQANSSQKGAMAAVLGLDDETVIKICNDVSVYRYISPANFNTPGQLVVSGETEAIEEATDLFLNHGAKKVIPLAVSGAFHSKLMDESAKIFAQYLQSIHFKEAMCPVISNVSGEFYNKNFLDLLSLQMKSPVQWTKSIQYIIKQGFSSGVDLGPGGGILQGMIRRITTEIDVKKAMEILMI